MGWGLEVLKMFCQRGIRIFSTCFVYVRGGGGGQVQYLSYREKIADPTPINK